MNQPSSSSSSSSSASAFGHAIDIDVKVKDNMTNTKIASSVEDEVISSDKYNLKEDGCTTAALPMQNDDDDASASAQSSQSELEERTFPQQLMDLIESETTDDDAVTVNGQKAIEWRSKGAKFIIRDKVALERRVLPKYFNNKCKSMSFVRKLYR